MPTTHVCLLNGSMSSILTPVIDPSIPSDKLVLIAQQAHQKEAELLLSIARTRGYKGEFRLLPDTLSSMDIKNALLDIFAELSNEEGDIWYNATGGERYHALIAFELAREFDFPVFVVEPDHDSLFWLYPENKASTPIQDKLKLHEYFTLLGINLEIKNHGNGISSELTSLSAKWVSDIEYYRTGLATLNFLAMNADSKQMSSRLDSGAMRNPACMDMLDDLASLQLVSLDNEILRFESEVARFYCNGGWLEVYVFSLIRSLSSEIRQIQDHTYGTELTRKISNRAVKNELDVTALVNNKLHIIECKTGKVNDTNASGMLYKLDSLNELVGDVRGRAALISYNELTPNVLARAAELNILALGPRQLPQMRAHLKRWFLEA